MIRFLIYFSYLRYTVISMSLLILFSLAISLGITTIPGLGKMLYDKVFVTFDVLMLYRYIGLQLYVVIFMALLTIVYALYENRLKTVITHKITRRFFNALLHSPLTFIQTNDTGYYVKRLVEDTHSIANGIAKTIAIICNSLVVVTVIAFMFIIEKWLCYLYVAVIGGALLWMFIWAIPIHRSNMKIGVEYTKLYKLYREIIQGIKEVKQHNLYGKLSESLEGSNRQLKKTMFLNATFCTSMWQYVSMFYMVGYLALLIHGVQRILSGEYSIGLLLGLLSIVYYFIDPINRIYSDISAVQEGVASARRLDIMVNIPMEANGCSIFKSVSDAIVFSKVSFSYDKDKVLNNVDLTIPKGAIVAIVGKTGSGKSSLFQLLTKLYGGYSGEISIDGVSIEHYDNRSIRDKILLVTQDVHLFNDTIRNNIDCNKTVTDEEMNRIIRKAHLEELVEKLDKKLDTIIGEDGARLSGGERQRVAVARSMVLNPEVIIYDEITASLDPQNEAMLLQSILDHFKGKTVIFISHRHATIKRCDLIYVIKNGNVVEKGTDTELTEAHGHYCNIFTIT